jgi:hypothetical protein
MLHETLVSNQEPLTFGDFSFLETAGFLVENEIFVTWNFYLVIKYFRRNVR